MQNRRGDPQNDVLNNMQPLKFCLAAPKKGDTGPAPKTFFLRYLKNVNEFLNTC